jgi:hypothetical protein
MQSVCSGKSSFATSAGLTFQPDFCTRSRIGALGLAVAVHLRAVSDTVCCT